MVARKSRIVNFYMQAKMECIYSSIVDVLGIPRRHLRSYDTRTIHQLQMKSIFNACARGVHKVCMNGFLIQDCHMRY